MPFYLVRYNPSGQAKKPKIYNLFESPCPCIMAGGVAGDNTSHYWLQYAEDERQILEEIKRRQA